MPLGSAQMERVPLETSFSEFDLTLSAVETEGGMKVAWQYRRGVFTEATIARLARRFEAVIEAMVTDPQARIGAMQLLDEAEWKQLQVWSNQSGLQEVRPPLPVVEQVEHQARTNGNLIAITDGIQQLTYGELKLLPFWDPLRGDPRFEKIVASLAPKEP